MNAVRTPGLLLPGEVAAIFRVDVRTVAHWADAGKLPSVRTIGGHRRYPVDGVKALFRAGLEAAAL